MMRIVLERVTQYGDTPRQSIFADKGVRPHIAEDLIFGNYALRLRGQPQQHAHDFRLNTATVCAMGELVEFRLDDPFFQSEGFFGVYLPHCPVTESAKHWT